MPFAIIFDVDGLLLDTERIAREGWRRAMSERGFTLTDEFYLNLVGRTQLASKPILLTKYGADFPFEEVYADRGQYIITYVRQHGIADRPGARSLLDYLQEKGVRMAVGSASPTDYSIEKLALTQLNGYFEVTVFGDEVPNSKPAPDIFLEAANRLNVPPKTARESPLVLILGFLGQPHQSVPQCRDPIHGIGRDPQDAFCREFRL